MKIGKRYDPDDGGAFDALQEEKGRQEGLLTLGDLPRGQARELLPEELPALEGK